MLVLVALKAQLREAFGDQHIIEVAQSGVEGLEILDELVVQGHIPLVVISDWLMPGMKGDVFLMEARKRFPYVITVMLSGQVDETALRQLREQACLHHFIEKPWDCDNLIRCIKNELEQFESSMAKHLLNKASKP